MRRSLLGSWRKERPSLRDWVAPGGSQSFDYTTTLTLRFHAAQPFRLAAGPNDGESLERMRHNVSVGPALDLGRPAILVHASDPGLAARILTPAMLRELELLAESGAPFELLILGVHGGGELRLQLGALLVDGEDLESVSGVVRELFEELRRARLVCASTRGPVS